MNKTTLTSPSQSIRPDANARADALCWASRLTTHVVDARAVAANAAPIFAWLAEATDRPDLSARCSAAWQQSSNDMKGGRAPDDDPAAFCQRATVLYRAIVGAA